MLHLIHLIVTVLMIDSVKEEVGSALSTILKKPLWMDMQWDQKQTEKEAPAEGKIWNLSKNLLSEATGTYVSVYNVQ